MKIVIAAHYDDVHPDMFVEDSPTCGAVQISTLLIAKALRVGRHEVVIFNRKLKRKGEHFGIQFVKSPPSDYDVFIAQRNAEWLSDARPGCLKILYCHDLYKREMPIDPDIIVCNSRYVADYMAEFVRSPASGLQSPPEIAHINIPIDTEMFRPGMKDRYKIVAIGAFVRCKRWGSLLDVYEMVKEEIPEAKLYVVGSDETWGRKDLDEAIIPRIYKVATSVRHLPYREVAKELKDAMIFLHTSEHETYSMATVEAMASGCVPVVSKVGAIVEHVAHRVNGFSHAPGAIRNFAGDIISVMRNPGIQARMALYNRRRILSEYSLLAVARRWNDLLAGDYPVWGKTGVGIMYSGEDKELERLLNSIEADEIVVLDHSGKGGRRQEAGDRFLRASNQCNANRRLLVDELLKRRCQYIMLADADVEFKRDWREIIVEMRHHRVATFEEAKIGRHEVLRFADGSYLSREIAGCATVFDSEVLRYCIDFPRSLFMVRVEGAVGRQLEGQGYYTFVKGGRWLDHKPGERREPEVRRYADRHGFEKYALMDEVIPSKAGNIAPNIVSILMDAYTAEIFEAMSWFKEPPCGGIYFSNVYAHAGDTTSNTTSVFTGYDIWGHGISQIVYHKEAAGNAPWPKVRALPTIVQLLQGYGYRTLLSGRDLHWNRLGFDRELRDFDDLHDLDRLKDLMATLPRELKGLSFMQRYFLHVHLWHCHHHEGVVESMADKWDQAKRFEGIFGDFLRFLLDLDPDTHILIWADHGDAEMREGARIRIEHHCVLRPEVQHTAVLYLRPDMREIQTDSRLHAQADLFALIRDLVGIEEKRVVEKRYAMNPLHTERDKVFAGSYYWKQVKRYPDGLLLSHEAMLEADPDFRAHVERYGELLPVEIKEVKAELREGEVEEVLKRLEALGYI